jgi:hypothetical protein
MEFQDLRFLQFLYLTSNVGAQVTEAPTPF